MASQASSTFSFPTLKRSACDRCRKQKLRCPSRASDAQHCSRCVRAGVECITGYTRPMGRSRRVPYYGPAESNSLGQSQASVSFHLAGSSSPQKLHYSTALQDAPASPPAADHHTDTRPRQTVPDSLMGMPSSPTWFLAEVGQDGGSFRYPDVLDDNVDLSGQPLLVDSGGRHFNPNYGVTDFDDSPAFPPSTALSPQYAETSEATCSSGPTSGGNTPSTSPPETTSGRALSRVSCDLRLSQLKVDLCLQAQRNMAACRQGAGAQAGPHHPGECPDTTSGRGREFGDALCSTSEFIAIIRSKVDDMGRDDPAAALINLSCVLDIISCYLLTVAVFERLVLGLCEQLARAGGETPDPDPGPGPDPSGASRPAGLQTLPGLHLAGFHVRHSNLQAKILIETIEHQFQMIEKGLGLPVELRVSSDRRGSCGGGLLQGGLDEGLLQAVITRLCPRSGSSVSLRECILRVRELLVTY